MADKRAPVVRISSWSVGRDYATQNGQPDDRVAIFIGGEGLALSTQEARRMADFLTALADDIESEWKEPKNG